MRFHILPPIFLAILALGAASPAAAQRSRPAGVQPLDQILPEIRRTNPGEFYDADGPTPGADGQEHYHLKWMRPDGRIEWLDTDARTGRVLGRSPGRDNFDSGGGNNGGGGGGGRRNIAPSPSYPYEPNAYGSRRSFRDPASDDGPPPLAGGWRRNNGPAYGGDEGPRGGYDGGWQGRRDRR